MRNPARRGTRECLIFVQPLGDEGFLTKRRAFARCELELEKRLFAQVPDADAARDARQAAKKSGGEMNLPRAIAMRVGRGLLLMLFAATGTILLVRFAPGFFADSREMDARYAQAARAEMEVESGRQQSVVQIARQEAKGWLAGDFGQSRQYGVPVAELIGARARVSALLLAQGILRGWLLAVCAALPISALRRGGLLWSLPFTLLLAIPASAMATACILADAGSPALVLSLLIAAREFKFLRSLLEEAWRAPHLLQGRAGGLAPLALVRMHMAPNIAPQLRALATLSIVTALGALVPIEVIFTVPGVGQLAWSAVMNRDLPVLVAVSLLMALVVALAGMLSTHDRTLEAA
jgi:peptide/nickel transport system permease protein